MTKEATHMTPLDRALDAAMADPEAQKIFYNVFLNSEIFVPVQEPSNANEAKDLGPRPDTFTPLLIASKDKAYLPLFDSLERLQAWAKGGMKYISLPGYALLEGLEGNVHLVLNLGTEHVKEFFLEEIQWLKELVAANKPQIAKYEGGTRLKISTQEIPESLREPLVQSLGQNSEVEAAYLVQIHLPDSPKENPHWLLVIKMVAGMESAFNSIAEHIAQLVHPCLPQTEFLDILPYAGEELEVAVVKRAEPFYKIKE